MLGQGPEIFYGRPASPAKIFLPCPALLEIVFAPSLHLCTNVNYRRESIIVTGILKE
jgi:hypothetical protein